MTRILQKSAAVSHPPGPTKLSQRPRQLAELARITRHSDPRSHPSICHSPRLWDPVVSGDSVRVERTCRWSKPSRSWNLVRSWTESNCAGFWVLICRLRNVLNLIQGTVSVMRTPRGTWWWWFGDGAIGIREMITANPLRDLLARDVVPELEACVTVCWESPGIGYVLRWYRFGGMRVSPGYGHGCQSGSGHRKLLPGVLAFRQRSRLRDPISTLRAATPNTALALASSYCHVLCVCLFVYRNYMVLYTSFGDAGLSGQSGVKAVFTFRTHASFRYAHRQP